MKFLKAILLTAILFSALGFTKKEQPAFIGTYGIAKNYPVKYELIINADHTFIYQDFTDPNNKIDAHGTWELKNDKLVLHEKSDGFPYGTKWKVEKDGKAVRTRKVLEFIRLAKL